jgi:hypothetical protein
MGGVGSGNRWNHTGRNTVEDCRSIDVRRWKREGYLTPGHRINWQWSRNGEVVARINGFSEAHRVVLSFRFREHAGDWQDVEEPITLERTLGTLGGHRVWFRCPAIGCGRRVAKLYGAHKYFACRHCYKLAYSSSRENAGDCATRRADKIRVRLGWEPGILNGAGDKPKWMRWRTFERLTNQADELTELSIIGMMQHLNIK